MYFSVLSKNECIEISRSCVIVPKRAVSSLVRFVVRSDRGLCGERFWETMSADREDGLSRRIIAFSVAGERRRFTVGLPAVQVIG